MGKGIFSVRRKTRFKELFESDVVVEYTNFLLMRMLLFSDIHANKNYCRDLVEMAEDVDLVIGAGDFGRLRTGISKTIGWLSEIEKPSLLVPGNAESDNELTKACKKWQSAIVLHGKGVVIDGINFYGIGGGIPITPFGPWSWDLSEEKASELLADCPEFSVLISHSPPKGILDLSSRGKHLGSKTIRDFIHKKSPQMIVCGHIHESGGKLENYLGTVVINAGPKGIIYEM